jgi:outer membrane protein
MLASGVAEAGTLREALIQAYNSNPTLTGQRARLRATDESVVIARGARLPQVSGRAGFTQSFNDVPGFHNGGRALTASGDVSMPIYSGGQLANSIHAADARVMAGRADVVTTESDVFTQAATAYMDVIRDAAIVQLNKNQVRVLQTNLEATRDRFQVGDLTRTDVAQSEARLANAQSQLASAQGTLTASEENYRRIIGTFPDRLDPPPPLPLLPATADLAVATALDRNPALDSIKQQAKAAGYDVRVARAGRLPTLAFQGGVSYNNYLGTSALAAGLSSNVIDNGGASAFGLTNQQTVSTVGVVLRVPIFQGGVAGARVRQAQAIQSQALEQGVETERAVVSNARSAFANFEATAETIRSSESAVSSNTLALDGVKAENGAGTRTILDVLNAEQELLSSKVQLVSAQHDHYVAGFNLLNSMGLATMRDLNLDGGQLYDPIANYNRVHGKISDWSDDPAPRPVATRTTGPNMQGPPPPAEVVTPPSAVPPPTSDAPPAQLPSGRVGYPAGREPHADRTDTTPRLKFNLPVEMADLSGR